MNTIQNQQSATYIEGMNSTGTADTDNGNDDGTCTQTAKRKGQLYFIITNISKKPNIKSLLRTAFAFGCQTIFVAGQKKFNFEYHGDHNDGDEDNDGDGDNDIGKDENKERDDNDHNDSKTNDNDNDDNIRSTRNTDIPKVLKPFIQNGMLRIIKFEKLEECVKHIKKSDIKIIGVEIDQTSVDLEEAVMCAGVGTGAGTSTKDTNDVSGATATTKITVESASQTTPATTASLFEGDTAFMMGNEGSGMNKKQMSLCDGFVKIKQYGGGTASLNVNVAAGIVLHRFHHWATSGDT